MIKVNYEDKSLVVEILTRAFDENKSVNYIIKQESKRVIGFKIYNELDLGYKLFFIKID